MNARKTLMMAAIAASVAASGASAQIPSEGGESGLWYYEIGGASPVSRAPNPNVTTVQLSVGGESSMGYSCGSFDPVLSVENTLNEVAQGMEDMVDQMVQAANDAIASLPAMVLQRANPGLYDLFQNNLLRAEEELELATKSCEQMEAELADGRNPYQEWVTVAKGDEWRASMGEGGDIVQVNEEIEESGGDEGLNWLGGRRGGQGQEPANAVGDTVRAGFNITLDRPATAGTPVGQGDDQPLLAQTWGSPSEAEEWTTRVVGDTHVRTCNGCESETTPGVGLLPIQEETNEEVQQDLQALVAGDSRMTASNLDDVSAPGVAITREVVESIREMPSQDQRVAVGRLAQEVASARTMEKALLARRMLLTGRKAPEIDSTGVAAGEIDAAVEELSDEIELMMQENKARQMMVSRTAGEVIREAEVRRGRSSRTPHSGIPSPIELQGGAVGAE